MLNLLSNIIGIKKEHYMRIIECQKITLEKYGLAPKDNVYFVRIDPEDLSLALQDILEELCDFSWLNKFDPDAVKECMKVNAKKTCDVLKERFKNTIGDPVINDAGEYIVSIYSKRGVVEKLGHNDIPLAELLGRQATGNPGFDFFTEEPKLQLVTCGEAKYVHGRNAYTTSLKQINKFIGQNKHISDIIIFNRFASDISVEKLAKNEFGICSAFSSTSIPSSTLISNICANSDFKQALKYEYIIMVAVDFI